ncbi:putative 4-mercaptohistidine N1-methyltransferase [Marinobacter sp. NP-4(2019)]|uniref:putative 4-mercaptohistidine N1-methyltransferase n=1 Tax=Marinobacter sp. NP-4(2019) TaxID=2488665 RepID=UPI000FC3D9A7|nr:putative 4-mercaptohistidine N1-methyltransferase [Marinobacter sp. NP-4(2019)]AZT85262.1 putative 4-mercaptohistidine N1-methyltransferase [Marinobacter sp. NP-4(2019)]
MNVYETDELLSQYLGFHYGDHYFGVSNYPARCAGICQEMMAGRDRRRALDLGCAVGRTAFELARVFDEVVGIDLSKRFVDAAQHLRQHGEIDYFRRDEGELGERVTIRLEELGLARAAERVSFTTGDACQLSAEHQDYDLIFAGNLIDRLQAPGSFLAGIHERLAVGGTLVISSPYTLMEEFTPRNNWIGGFELNGQPRSVLDGMRDILSSHFELIQPPMDVTFVIRETRRKFQHTIAELTGWRRVR